MTGQQYFEVIWVDKAKPVLSRTVNNPQAVFPVKRNELLLTKSNVRSLPEFEVFEENFHEMFDK